MSGAHVGKCTNSSRGLSERGLCRAEVEKEEEGDVASGIRRLLPTCQLQVRIPGNQAEHAKALGPNKSADLHRLGDITHAR